MRDYQKELQMGDVLDVTRSITSWFLLTTLLDEGVHEHISVSFLPYDT